MDLAIKGRVALITGASGGIGLATAKQLSEEGVQLILSDLKLDALQKPLPACLASPCCSPPT